MPRFFDACNGAIPRTFTLPLLLSHARLRWQYFAHTAFLCLDVIDRPSLLISSQCSLKHSHHHLAAARQPVTSVSLSRYTPISRPRRRCVHLHTFHNQLRRIRSTHYWHSESDKNYTIRPRLRRIHRRSSKCRPQQHTTVSRAGLDHILSNKTYSSLATIPWHLTTARRQWTRRSLPSILRDVQDVREHHSSISRRVNPT